MTCRVAMSLLLACATGCIGDPKVDRCRDVAESCDVDDASTEPAHRDAAADGSVGGSDAGAPPPIDASHGAVDSTVPLDSSLRDAAPGYRDATPYDGVHPQVLPLQGDLGVHDPSIIEAEGAFTIFSTGPGISVKRSTDLLTWTDGGRVFAANPAWIASQVPGATDLWAPDIRYFGGQYHLYYAASTFGTNRSCIGHATATNLSALDFVDHGPVICSVKADDYNAIDPAFIADEDGTGWLSFGSFWSGIKLIRLDASGQRSGTEMYSLASRDTVEAIEAPFIIRRGPYYYLFASFDLCCRGAGSTYRIMVGRSESVTGPYADAEGTPMLSQGGGSMVVIGNQRWRGPGHNAVLTSGDRQYLVYHAYDADHDGVPTLRITDLLFDDTNWPAPSGP